MWWPSQVTPWASGLWPSICPHNHHAMPLPVVPTQPLPTVRPFANQIQIPKEHPVWGHSDTPSDLGLLDPLSEPWAVGVGTWTAQPPSGSL